MARLIVPSLLIVALAISGAIALNIDINIPSTKEAAISQINRGAGMGKGKVNGAITWWVANVNSDPDLTEECKVCCAAKAQEIRADVLAQIDSTAAELVTRINNTLTILLGGLLIEIWNQLLSRNGLIVSIVRDLDQSLEGAKQTCILETANATTAAA